MLDAALAVVARACPVFPCDPDSKQPVTRQGFKDASADPEVIRRLWQRRPEAMVGLPTGPATGLLVIDLDPPARSEEHTSELQSLMRISYAVFCLKKKTQ